MVLGGCLRIGHRRRVFAFRVPVHDRRRIVARRDGGPLHRAKRKQCVVSPNGLLLTGEASVSLNSGGAAYDRRESLLLTSLAVTDHPYSTVPIFPLQAPF